jgi:hypothetical protein
MDLHFVTLALGEETSPGSDQAGNHIPRRAPAKIDSETTQTTPGPAGLSDIATTIGDMVASGAVMPVHLGARLNTIARQAAPVSRPDRPRRKV